MQKTWLEVFHEQTNLNQYPIALRTRGGIGYKMPGGETVSNFVGHPVHYFENGLWKPITLQPHANGDFEGSPFSWRGKQVFYKGKTLFEPRAVIFNGVEHKLFLRQDGNRIVADLNFGGSAAQYEIQFRESGVRELLTIFEPVEGLLEFDVPHANKPDGLFKKDRHIIGGITAETFQLTKDMSYPLVIDPAYDADTADGYVEGVSTVDSTARSTSTDYSTGGSNNLIGRLSLGGNYYYWRIFELFDTSGIPDGDNVTDATMDLVVTTDDSNQDFSIEIVKHDWSSQNPLSAGNRETAFDDCLAGTLDATWRSTSGISTNTVYTSPSLDTTRINKTGMTYYSLRSDRDYNNSGYISSREHVEIASASHGTSGYRPVLTVTHAAGGSNTSNFFVMF